MILNLQQKNVLVYDYSLYLFLLSLSLTGKYAFLYRVLTMVRNNHDINTVFNAPLLQSNKQAFNDGINIANGCMDLWEQK